MKEPKEFHEGMLWMLEEGDGFIVGVTQSALDASGSLSDVEIADVGDEFEAGDWIGEIRGKNATLDIVAPFSLKVIERNEEAAADAAVVEDDPTGDAWLLRVERNG